MNFLYGDKSSGLCVKNIFAFMKISLDKRLYFSYIGIMKNLTVKMMESRRQEMMLGVAEFAEWLGFKTKAQNRTRALISRYREFCKAISGETGYYAGPKLRRKITKKLEFLELALEKK